MQPALCQRWRGRQGHRAGPRYRGTRRRCPGLLEEGRGPTWRPGTHTLRGSIPGAEDGREEPSPGGGGAGSKPFTALWGDQNSKGRREEKEAHVKSLYTQEISCFL